MGHLREAESLALVEMGLLPDEASALRFHLSTNFFPPLPAWVQERVVLAFQRYWNGEIEHPAESLHDVITENGIERYFSTFLHPEYDEDLLDLE